MREHGPDVLGFDSVPSMPESISGESDIKLWPSKPLPPFTVPNQDLATPSCPKNAKRLGVCENCDS